MVTVVAKPNPFKPDETYLCHVQAGTLLSFLLEHAHPTTQVLINGERIQREQWGDTVIMENDFVVVVNAPKLPPVIAVILTVVSAVAAIANTIVQLVAEQPKINNPAQPIGGRYGPMTSQSNQPNRFGVIPKLYGRYRINPPLAANYYFSTVGGNQFLYLLLCLGYGPLRIGPDNTSLASDGITQQYHIVGRKMDVANRSTYYPLLKGSSEDGIFYGTQNITSTFGSDVIRFGNTAIENFAGAKWEIGHPSQITLYSEDTEFQEVNYQYNIPVGRYGGYSEKMGKKDGRYYWFEYTLGNGNPAVTYTVTTNPNTNYAVIELLFSNGLFCSNSKGGVSGGGVRLLVEYKLPSSSVWTPYDYRTNPAYSSDYWVIPTFSFGIQYNCVITSSTREPLRRPLVVAFAVAGTYAIRVTRQFTYAIETNAMYTDFIWTELRSVRTRRPWIVSEHNSSNDVVLMALKVKNSGQFTGNVDTVTVYAQSVLKVLTDINNRVWEWLPTANPAWAYVDALSGIHVQNPVDVDTELNVESIYDWYQWCRDSNYYYTSGPTGYGTKYHWYHTEEESLLDRLKVITAAGRASWSFQDNKFGIVSDFSREDAFVPRQFFTPRNSRNLTFTRHFVRRPHALRVRYIDRDVYQEAEQIVYGWKDTSQTLAYSETDAQQYEVLETQGVLDFEQATREGVYFLNVQLTRQETYTLETDIENLVVTRGDCVKIAYDTMHASVVSARVVSTTQNAAGLYTTITLDTPVRMYNRDPEDSSASLGLPSSYGLYIRYVELQQKDSSYPIINPYTSADSSGFHTTLAFVSPVPNSPGIMVGDLVVFGLISNSSFNAKVTKVEYRDDLSAKLTLINASTREKLERVPDTNVNTKTSKVAPLVDLRRPGKPTKPHLAFAVENVSIDGNRRITPAIVAIWSPNSNDSDGNISPLIADYIVHSWLLDQAAYDAAALNPDLVDSVHTFDVVKVINPKASLSVFSARVITDSGEKNYVLKVTVQAGTKEGRYSDESAPAYIKLSDANVVLDDNGTPYLSRYSSRQFYYDVDRRASVRSGPYAVTWVYVMLPANMTRTQVRMSAKIKLVSKTRTAVSTADKPIPKYWVTVYRDFSLSTSVFLIGTKILTSQAVYATTAVSTDINWTDSDTTKLSEQKKYFIDTGAGKDAVTYGFTLRTDDETLLPASKVFMEFSVFVDEAVGYSI
jgi:hypothetical protein